MVARIVLLVVRWVVCAIFCSENGSTWFGAEANTQLRCNVISDLIVLSNVNSLLEIVSVSVLGHEELRSISGYRCSTCWLILDIILYEFGSKVLCYEWLRWLISVFVAKSEYFKFWCRSFLFCMNVEVYDGCTLSHLFFGSSSMVVYDGLNRKVL